MAYDSRLSKFEYEESRVIAGHNFSFYALLAAAMRKADNENGPRLQEAFPNVWDDLQERYNAPGGILPEEIPDGDA